MLKKVKDYIINNNMPVAGQKIVLGLSGGADSVFMLHIMHKLSTEMGFRIICAHLNHMIRGEEANKDAEFCHSLCENMGIELQIGEFDVSAYAKEKGLSVEEAGRQVRYSFFHIMKKEYNANLIATAHNKNDLAESVLLHLMRGSGIEGLRGIQPIRQDGVIRPIMDVERSEIERYCHDNGIAYVTDSTNEDEMYTRNRVRKLLLPLMQSQFNPDIINTLSNLSYICGEDSDFINSRVESYRRLIQTDETGIFIDTNLLTPLPPSIARRIIMEMSEQCGVGVSFEKTSKILQLALFNKTGKELHIGGAVFWISYDSLYVAKEIPQTPTFEYPLNIGSKVTIPELNITVSASISFINETNDETQYFDITDMDSDICVRNRRDGDTITLECGTKKLKDFFIDEKIPKHKRDSIPLLAHGSNIIWIMGIRRASVLKPNANHRALKVTFEGAKDNA